MKGFKNNFISKVSIMVIVFIICFSIFQVNAVLKNEKVIDKSVIINAENWVIKQQNEDGSFGNDDEVKLYATSEVYRTLETEDKYNESLMKAKDRFKNYEPNNFDYLIRMSNIGLNNSSDLIELFKSSQNSDGGFGVCKDYSSDVLDTALIEEWFISQNQKADRKAVEFLISKQNKDGSFQYTEDGKNRVKLTSLVLEVLNTYAISEEWTQDVSNAISFGTRYLKEQLKEQDLEFDDYVSACRVLLRLADYDEEMLVNIQKSVLNEQGEDGSFHEDVVTTAHTIDLLRYINSIDIKNSKIESVIVTKDDSDIETDSFFGDETIKVKVKHSYEDIEEYKCRVLLRNKDGNVEVFTLKDKDYEWSTKSTPAGTYDLVVKLINVKTNSIIQEVTKKIDIQETLRVNSFQFNNNNTVIEYDKPNNVNFHGRLDVFENIPSELKFVLKVTDDEDKEIYTGNKSLKVSRSGLYSMDFDEFTFTPVEGHKYKAKIEIFGQGQCLKSVEKDVQAFSDKDPASIEILQECDKECLFTGRDDINLTYSIKGVGAPYLEEREPYDLIFLLDTSGSIGVKYLEAQKEALKKLISIMREDDNLGIAEFGSKNYFKFLLNDNLSHDKEQLYEMVDNVKTQGYDSGTSIAVPIKNATEFLKSRTLGNRKKMIILISDGGSRGNSDDAKDAANNNIKINTMMVTASGSRRDAARMEGIAKETGGLYYKVDKEEDIIKNVDDFMAHIFNYAGKELQYEINMPKNNLNIKSIEPKADEEVHNSDGSTTYTWKKQSLLIGETDKINISLSLENLKKQQEIVLSNNFKASYKNYADEEKVKELDEFKVLVDNSQIDASLNISSKNILPKQDLNIDCSLKNLSRFDNVISRKVVVLNSRGEVCSLIDDVKNESFKAFEKKASNYTWNTGNLLEGKYEAAVIIEDSLGNVSTKKEEFNILSDGNINARVNTDKIEYENSDDIIVKTSIQNTSSNYLMQGYKVKEYLINVDDKKERQILEKDLPSVGFKDFFQYSFKIEDKDSTPGCYKVFMQLVDSENKVICEDSAVFRIKENKSFDTALEGILNLNKNIYNTDEAAELNYKFNNIGNTDIQGIDYEIEILDTHFNKLSRVYENKIDLNQGEKYEESINHNMAMAEGNYYCTFSGYDEDSFENIFELKSFQVNNDTDIKSEINISSSTLYPESDLNISIIAKNNGELEKRDNIKVLILDDKNNIISALGEDKDVVWQGTESKEFDYKWNTKNYPAGKYSVKFVIEDSNGVKKEEEMSFVIESDGVYFNKIAIDKGRYSKGDYININSIIYNTTSSSIYTGGRLEINLIDAYGHAANILTYKLQDVEKKNSSNIDSVYCIKEEEGQYKLEGKLYDSNNNLISSDYAFFEVCKVEEFIEDGKGEEQADVSYTYNNNKPSYDEEVKITDKTNTEDKAKTGDNNNIYIYTILIIAMFSVLMFFIKRKGDTASER